MNAEIWMRKTNENQTKRIETTEHEWMTKENKTHTKKMNPVEFFPLTSAIYLIRRCENEKGREKNTTNVPVHAFVWLNSESEWNSRIIRKLKDTISNDSQSQRTKFVQYGESIGFHIYLFFSSKQALYTHREIECNLVIMAAFFASNFFFSKYNASAASASWFCKNIHWTK